MSENHRSYKKNKPRMFFFFLLLSLLFWVLTKFSKESTATIQANLKFDNLPENTVLKKDYPESISFDVSGNGFEFLSYKLKSPTINIDISNFADEEEKGVTVSRENLTQLINNQLDQDISIRNLSLNGLDLQLDTILAKKVPILVNSEISFKDGFKQKGATKVTPDSVSISGPENLLAEYDEITTKTLSLSGVDEPYKDILPLNVPENELIKLSPTSVTVNIDVQEFTQKQLVLQVKVINLPEGTNIKLIPNNLNLSFDVPVEEFNNISANQFELICDFEARNTEGNFMTPMLRKKPKFIQHIEYSTKRIDFLIFK